MAFANLRRNELGSVDKIHCVDVIFDSRATMPRSVFDELYWNEGNWKYPEAPE